MKMTKWNDGWKFWIDRDSFALVWTIPEEARDVTLPHDAMLENAAHPDSPNGGNTGFRDGAVYTYVKNLYAPKEYRGKTVLLRFEGVYMNAFVYVNGQLAAKNPFGYTVFDVPLDDFLNYGFDNEIRVQVRAGAMTNSRWYSGAGIYRDVYLMEGGMVCVAPNGLQIKTEEADAGLAVLGISVDLINREALPQALHLIARITDPSGTVAATETLPLVLLGQETRVMSMRLAVESPSLWSAETPFLYTCSITLTADGPETILDGASADFGVRTLQVDVRRGLRINGQTVKLRGACIHHDSGLLGAATYEDAQLRQIRLLKQAGFNAIRMAHHPAAPALLRACDQVGMYVMNEGFDMWNRLKSDYDYGLCFREWWEKDVTAMVNSSYNHPSVILYSVGNEIPEIGTVHGAKLCHDISRKIKSLDDTRFTLAAINGVFAAGDAVGEIMKDVTSGLAPEGSAGGSVNDFLTLMDSHLDDIVVHQAISERLDRACAGLDIAGYNYMTARYEPDGSACPNRVIVGSETYPPEIARNWTLVEKLPYVIGDFTWTGWDYIGEAGVGVPAYHFGEGGFGAGFPCQLAYCGDLDLTGFRRPTSYYREVVFGLRSEPYIAVQNPKHYGEALIKTPWVISDASHDWTFEGYEGNPVIVEVYAPGTEVELFQNGVSLGRKASGVNAEFRALFETIYEPGKLLAVAYDGEQELSRSCLVSAGKLSKIQLRLENAPNGNGAERELYYIDVALTDDGGETVCGQDQKLALCVRGADVLGFGSGDPRPAYNFNEGVTKTFCGRAQIILKKASAARAEIEVTAENGLSGSLTFLQ